MYNFMCAHCGRIEILHLDGPDLTGLLPSLEYGGEEPTKQEIKNRHRPLSGYHFNLRNCPGFKYSGNISKRTLILEAMEHPSTIPYVDEDIGIEARKALQE